MAEDALATQATLAPRAIRPHPLLKLLKLLDPADVPPLPRRRMEQLMLTFCGPEFPPPRFWRTPRYRRRGY